jgi:hypothetical protein
MALHIVKGRTREQWAEEIKSKRRDSVAGIFDLGRSLANSQEELSKSDFWAMVREDLGYSRTTVVKITKIATDPKLLECSHANIPADYSILYALARLTDDQFDRGIENGTIHAGMKRKDVALLKPPKEEPPPLPALTGRDLIDQRTQETRRLIVAVLRELNGQDQNDYLALVRLQLDDIEERRRAA